MESYPDLRVSWLKKRKWEIFSAIVNDSPGILYYDNKRRRLLRKPARAAAFTQLVRPALSRFISLSLFSLSQWPPCNAVEEQRTNGEAGETGEAGTVRRDTVELPWIHLAKWTTRFGPVNPSIPRVPHSLPYFFPLPLVPACCRKFIAFRKLYSHIS